MNAWRFMAVGIGFAALAYAARQAVELALMLRKWIHKQGKRHD